MKPNVVLITLDCVRPDYLGCYGVRPVKTPVVDSIAKNGIIFENAYTHCPITGPAHLSLFTSTLPITHGIRLNACPISKDQPTMAEFIQRAGYHTAAFVGAFVLSRKYGFDRGFDFYDDKMMDKYIEPFVFSLFNYKKIWGGLEVGKFSRSATRVTNSAIRWLKAKGKDKPFFIWLHYFDAHDHFRLPLPLHLLYFRRRNYQQNIEYIDNNIGRLLSYLKKRHLLEDTIFIIFSDHGESLNEYQFKGRDYTGHSVMGYEVTLRTPLLLKGPMLPKGKVSKQVFRHIDLLPTLLGLLGIDTAHNGFSFEGINLSDVIKGGLPEKDLEVYAETLMPIAKGLSEWRILISGYWKYVFKPQSNEEILYNLKEDPKEITNIIQTYPEIAKEMKEKLLNMIKGDQTPPVPDYDKKVRTALEALGYM